MNDNAIRAAIPHRAPFLLVDRIVQRDERRIVCEKTFRKDEFWFEGHYPDFPVTPGVLLCEAAMQTGAVLLAGLFSPTEGKVPVATRLSDVKFKQLVRPGDTILMDVVLVEQLADAYFLKAKVTVNDKTAVRFGFACKLVKP